ncbi:cell wall-binding repeat-containing protein, partial [Clostridioides difficile]|nr:cell wall-binding repeat-containing protein [Clostridioides difficile]
KYVIQIVGELTFDATDKQIKMASGDEMVDPSDNTYVLTLTKGTVKNGDVKANVEVTGLPSGLDYTAVGNTSANTITVTVSGTANPAVQNDLDNVSVLVKAGAVSEATATDSVANTTFEVKKYVIQIVGELTFDAT